MVNNNDTEQILEAKEQIKEKKKPSKPRCHCCNKKLKMVELNFKCKCGHTFCQLHLNPHSHKCSFDYQSERKEMIKNTNPKMCVKVIEVK
uniref:AN1-type domain-containing protein n=1 Tax=viral metagenome TaxID=1070528 RepID=A0A6C0CEK8_9ZZZZ